MHGHILNACKIHLFVCCANHKHTVSDIFSFSCTFALVPSSLLMYPLMFYETGWGCVSCSISVSCYLCVCEVIRHGRMEELTRHSTPQSFLPKNLVTYDVCVRSVCAQMYDFITEWSSKTRKLNHFVWNLFCFLKTWGKHGQTSEMIYIFLVHILETKNAVKCDILWCTV